MPSYVHFIILYSSSLHNSRYFLQMESDAWIHLVASSAIAAFARRSSKTSSANAFKDFSFEFSRCSKDFKHIQMVKHGKTNTAMIKLRPPNARRPIAALQCWSWHLLSKTADVTEIHMGSSWFNHRLIFRFQPALPSVATQGLQVQPWHAYAGIYQLRKNLMNSLDKNSSAIALPRSKSSCTRQKGTHSVGLWALHLQNAAGCCRLLQICMGVASDLHLICSFRRGCPMSAPPVAENQRVLRQNKAAPKPTAPRTSRTRSHKAGEFREVREVSCRFETFRYGSIRFVCLFMCLWLWLGLMIDGEGKGFLG